MNEKTGGFDPNGTWAQPDYPRSPLEGSFVGVMRLKLEARGLQLIPQGSRCIRRFDVHELIITEERTGPSGRADKVAYLGFVEFARGGVMLTGDEVRIGDALVGTIAGYDETHMPNHLNIVLTGSAWTSGVERGIALGQAVRFDPVFDRARRA
jgi:hypothetical protein